MSTTKIRDGIERDIHAAARSTLGTGYVDWYYEGLEAKFRGFYEAGLRDGRGTEAQERQAKARKKQGTR